MYALSGGGVMNDLVNLYYTNAGSLRHNQRVPKITQAVPAFKNDDIDVVSISEPGLKWSKQIENMVKWQLAEVKGSTIMSTSSVEDGDSDFLTGGTLTATMGGITGGVTKKGDDKQGR